MEPITRGEIYYTNLDDAIGCEQGGHRPVLILQSDLLNPTSPTAIVAPITSIIKNPFMQSHCILPPHSPLRERSMVLTEQVRTLDRQRLGAYVGRLQAKELRDVEQALCYTLGLIE